MKAPEFQSVTFSVFLFSRKRVNNSTRCVLAISSTKAVTFMKRGEHGPSFQYMTLFEIKIVRKPVLTGVKKFPLIAFAGKLGVGKSVAVMVGVNNSAPNAVTVGVNVSGVGVDVAKRFCEGIARTVADGG